ncbi:MAG: ribose 5-phosphate isomerase B [Actinobacteria bacterium]|nr:ribose 5-phosphate isomerase B [Actinomycetota bacterium]MTA64485.1 ribose 5-phosphate isomerase B [Actinomycetota bacterium]
MRVVVGSDHGGLSLKNELAEYLSSQQVVVTDLGTHSADSVDYPEFGAAVGRAVAAGEADFGVAVCGSGLGICIAANKIAGIRAVTIHDVTSARLSRAHNDANVICLGERLIGAQVAKDAVDAFFATEFEGGRHAHRVHSLDALIAQQT